MRDVPKDLSIKTVALWLRDSLPGRVWPTDEIDMDFIVLADAVLALVREAVTLTRVQERVGGWTDDDAIIARVMGDKEDHHA